MVHQRGNNIYVTRVFPNITNNIDIRKQRPVSAPVYHKINIKSPSNIFSATSDILLPD